MSVPPIDDATEARTVEDVYYDAANFQYDDLDGDDLVERAEPRSFSVRAEIATGSLIAAFALGVLTTVAVLTLRDRMDD